jgi:hypothetical protein
MHYVKLEYIICEVLNMDTEQTPVMESNEQMSAPEPVISANEVVKENVSKKAPVIGILVILVLALMCGLTYFVLKDRGINLLSGTNVEDVAKNEDTTATENDTNKTCTTDSEGKESVLTLENAGWALFSMPEYEYSVELPSYSISQKLGTAQQNVSSFWTSGIVVDTTEHYISSYVKTVNLSFAPEVIPDGVNCGDGCLNEHSINVAIFENKGDIKEVSALKDSYTQQWTKANKEDSEAGVVSLKTETATKWEKSVVKYTLQTPSMEYTGYLVLGTDYIYDVKGSFSSTPVESYEISQKVLDSMKFEE